MSDTEDSDDGKKAAAANTKNDADENDEQLPALFWDTMPDDPESHPDFAALQALAEESTPEERAENFKTQGNNKVKVGLQAKNRHLLRDAVDFYGKGIAVRSTDPLINAALLSNRAHVQILLGNWRHALRDAEAAARLRPDDPKARHRAARAALELDELGRAAALLRGVGVGVERGEGDEEEEEEEEKEEGPKTNNANKKRSPLPPPLDLSSSDPSTRAEFEALARRLVTRRSALRRERERERLARERAMKPALELARAVLERGLALAAPAVNRVGSKSARPRLCPQTSQLRWPVVFMYPEAPHAPDVIEDAGEDDLLADHLDVVSFFSFFAGFFFRVFFLRSGRRRRGNEKLTNPPPPPPLPRRCSRTTPPHSSGRPPTVGKSATRARPSSSTTFRARGGRWWRQGPRPRRKRPPSRTRCTGGGRTTRTTTLERARPRAKGGMARRARTKMSGPRSWRCARRRAAAEKRARPGRRGKSRRALFGSTPSA
jgi:tetratricopeptide (TPR) repeat protein